MCRQTLLQNPIFRISLCWTFALTLAIGSPMYRASAEEPTQAPTPAATEPTNGVDYPYCPCPRDVCWSLSDHPRLSGGDKFDKFELFRGVIRGGEKLGSTNSDPQLTVQKAIAAALAAPVPGLFRPPLSMAL